MARKWCVDRALRPATVTAAATLVDEAVAYGFRFGPRGLLMTIRWLDLDRFRIDLVWQGCTAQALATGADGESLQRSVRAFDRMAEQWGLGTTGGGESRHWFTVDTRPADRRRTRDVG